MSLKGKQSRHRTKFIKRLEERLQEVAEEDKQLLQQHCRLDEQGNPKIINGERYDVKDIEAFSKDKQELYNEELVIDDGDSQAILNTVRTILDECNVEFKDQQATLYDYLCDQFKVDETIEENNKNEKDVG
nr:hypothetical protein [Virgibacillus natechei]